MLSLVPTPIGNISDISLRSLDVLSAADVILCEDTRVTKKLIHLLKERHNLTTAEPQFLSLHSHNEADFVSKLTPEFFNANIVYVSDAGMPGISDPGQILVRYCLDQGIDYDILPGANAALTAFVASGFVETKMLFFGFLPHKGNDRSSALQEALFNGYTTILYESPKRLDKLLSELVIAAPERQVFLAKELSKRYQKFYRGTASELIPQMEKEIRGEWVVVIEASEAKGSSLSEQDILALDIPKKAASKLIAKITGENPKECYQRLL
ncbi:16S rRNA (cytidine(1402)-2'-O)-methyltransferase [Sulfuricurvum sp.]|uniref:16S rRNA (cytidine(1402)-2'-O)-methyltransferase n=1 Tax=Sulfuricurvum sp. TaxID=2025608 RepID=UPI00262CD744|nr:16S rRNA (cytidine(1402)-2'-O)-methyltransferase [Sulfuricurvum sp.]MDD2265860.1 16S rRNA (cytidine(1402)-2'-O)-methyltransferase [Sulfuricurvum sp.]MDD2784616.1 16S rRNA (cytidine(1402)-2'-O)-methyltransferase [Sulfuricurvum sp.]HZF71007.1 16S rRNA (cytidine(1402)-2'-O)-methyltransferase [Sulfuricurvum sp.]